MKNQLFLPLFALLLVTFLFSCTGEPVKDDAQETSAKAFDIHRGVNISHWLSQSKNRGEKRKTYFTEKDVEAAAGAGFDHIRIPIDEEQMWDTLGNKEAEAFGLLHQALGWMEKHGLKAIVDLHIIRSHHFLDEAPALYSDPAEQEKFAQLWVDLSDELKKYPLENVAYELLNESVAKDHDDWNKVYRMAYDKVREREPNRVIFLGPNHFQNVKYFPYLKVPEKDPNIVLSYHFYIPHPITHYKASWTNIRDYAGPVNYPGVPIEPQDTLDLPEEVRATVRKYTSQTYDKATLESLMDIAIQTADSLNLQLYCGEFGSYDRIPRDMRNRWYADVISIFEKHGIAWSAWDLKSSGFGVFNPEDHSLMIPKEILFGGEDY